MSWSLATGDDGEEEEEEEEDAGSDDSGDAGGAARGQGEAGEDEEDHDAAAPSAAEVAALAAGVGAAEAAAVRPPTAPFPSPAGGVMPARPLYIFRRHAAPRSRCGRIRRARGTSPRSATPSPPAHVADHGSAKRPVKVAQRGDALERARAARPAGACWKARAGPSTWPGFDQRFTGGWPASGQVRLHYRGTAL